jgi:PAS domain S-box-containing protein
MDEPLAVDILVIEDDADTCANLRDILELDGHRIVTAARAAEALDRDNWERFTAIILDRRLPDATAEQLLPRLKALAPSAAVIVVTGYADLQGAISALRQGATDYILKPIEAEDLRARLRRIALGQRAGHELKRQETLIRSLLDSISDAVIVVDRRGKVLLQNPAVARMIGRLRIGASPEEWAQVGRFFRPDGESLYSLRELPLARALESEQIIDEEVYIRHPGEPSGRWLSVNAGPIRDEEGVSGAVVIYHDITERKAAVGRALRAERLAAIGQVVAGLAHESRNALQRSQACLEMLALHVRDRPLALDLIDRLQKAQDHLHRLFEDVRGYAAPIVLNRCPCDIATVWREAWAHLETARREKDATLRESIRGVDLHCVADAFRLGQVFQNIFDNALAAGERPVVIEVRAEVAELESKPAVRLFVCDNGPGLDPQQRQKVFDPFFTTKAKGTGLGMAIARRIVEAHGGQIAVGDGDGAGAGAGEAPGAVFIMTLPRGSP